METNDKTKNISELFESIFRISKDLSQSVSLVAALHLDKKCKVSKNVLWDMENLVKELKLQIDELGKEDVWFNE